MLLKVERKKTDVSLVAMIKCDATVRRIFSGGRREKKQSESGEFHHRNSDHVVNGNEVCSRMIFRWLKGTSRIVKGGKVAY